MTVTLFVPCFVDQLAPRVAVAALTLLERLGVDVTVPTDSVCCGQPATNAGYAREGERILERLARSLPETGRIVVPSGSCALHVRRHAASLGEGGRRLAARTMEFTEFLHDDVGIERVASVVDAWPRTVAVHVGCHALRGLHLARASECVTPPFDKVRALLATVPDLSFVTPARRDECCGFGGTFSVTEPAVSAAMGIDRLQDYAAAGAEAIVSTDPSCMLHLAGLTRAARPLPVWHVAEVLAGCARE